MKFLFFSLRQSHVRSHACTRDETSAVNSETIRNKQFLKKDGVRKMEGNPHGISNAACKSLLYSERDISVDAYALA